jgi:hypothetical protein
MAISLTRPEVEQAIYIDFEGTQKDAPVMLGILWVTPDGEEHLEQLVFDSTLESASDAKSLKSGDGYAVQVKSLEAALIRVLELSEGLGVPVIEWSIREEQVLDASGLPDDVKQRMKSRIKNGLPVARRWAKKHHNPKKWKTDRRGKHFTLGNFADVTGYEVPTLYGSGNSASRVREVLRQIEKYGDYGSITGVAKRKWSSFLKHNEHDLRATRHVMNHVIPELSYEIRRPRRRQSDFPYATRPFPEDSCPDCGGVLSRYVYGFTRGLPAGQISGGCQIWPGMPNYRCDYCWEDYIAVRNKRPRRVTRRDRCMMMVKDWGWAPKSVAANQGVPVEVFTEWLREAERTWS